MEYSCAHMMFPLCLHNYFYYLNEMTNNVCYPVLHQYVCIQIFLFEIYIYKWCDILPYISNI
jgi:hypothetical protein